MNTHRNRRDLTTDMPPPDCGDSFDPRGPFDNYDVWYGRLEKERNRSPIPGAVAIVSFLIGAALVLAGAIVFTN